MCVPVYIYIHIYVYVCVCVRERERERDSLASLVDDSTIYDPSACRDSLSSAVYECVMFTAIAIFTIERAR